MLAARVRRGVEYEEVPVDRHRSSCRRPRFERDSHLTMIESRLRKTRQAVSTCLASPSPAPRPTQRARPRA